MTPSANANTSFLNFPGEMARLIREKDWSTTPFGPMEGWSTALRSAVSIILGSRFPMVLYWGETRALIYNDAWAPVPGQKHPWALGTPGYEVWAEIWDIIGPMFDQVMNEGVATWSDDQLLPLNRYGYVEECYFYYSYSPVRGDDGTVEGVFTAVTETTYRVLAERRERLLREISEATSKTRSAMEACSVALDRLAGLPEEAPYILAYLRDEATGRYQLDCRDIPAALVGRVPDSVDLHDPVLGGWLADAARSGTPVLIDSIREWLGLDLPGHPWPEPVEQGLVVPILSPRPEAPHGFLVPALSPRRRYTTEYGTLFERIAGFITAAITNAEAYAEERRRAEKLAELDRAKTAFFSNASHEFRTPLTLMLGPVEEMLRDADGASREDLAMVHRNGQRLLRLVNTLLDFSRIEAGRVQARFEATDLAAYTADLASSFRSAMERAGLQYRIDCPPLAALVWVDREMWEKIVLNLISNAFKYTLAGEVVVALRARDSRVRLEVSDTGVGIPEAELTKVFDRFHRIEGQQGRTHEGTGIGLALVKDLAQLLGGEVEVARRESVGTSFAVTIPLGRDHVPADALDRGDAPASTAVRAETFVSEALRWLPGESDETPPVEEPTVGDRGKGQRILLADDNADMRGYVERLLTAAGYRVDAVPDGLAAAERAAAAPPDLVLSDVMMPHLDGFALVERLRADEATANLPIILLSARAGEEESIEGLEAGADDYLVKPFSARELIARVEGALRLAKSRRETADVLREANDALEARVAERTRERDRSWRLSRDLIGVADFDGRWQAVNPAWQRVLGWEPAEIIGRTSEWMEHPDDVEKTRAEIGRLADGAVTFEFENRFRRKQGGYAILNWTAVPDEEGHLYCIARDVTEERERAAELARAQDALRQSQKMEAIGQLTGGIAHDFNNMLTGVIGSLDLLQRRLEPERNDPRITRYVQAATTSAQRAAALTQRLLAFGRRQSLDLQTVDVNKLVTGMEELLHRSLGENISLTTRLSADAWQVCTDANQLENALLNLCINARDAMPDGGTLTITTENRRIEQQRGAAPPDDVEPGDYVVLSVSDTGSGMDAETLGKVFEPFFTTKPIGKGTGLGLSMIYGFAQQMHGTVEIDSTPGEGTSVRVLIPRSTGSEAVGCVDEDIALGGGETVLVVEDEAEVRMLVTETLGELGYAALEATDSSSALLLLRDKHRIDLMVSDVGLPGMNGRALADEARKLRPGLKVLLITGYAADAADRVGFLGPDVSMMQKPFAIEALSNTIKRLLEGR